MEVRHGTEGLARHPRAERCMGVCSHASHWRNGGKQPSHVNAGSKWAAQRISADMASSIVCGNLAMEQQFMDSCLRWLLYGISFFRAVDTVRFRKASVSPSASPARSDSETGWPRKRYRRAEESEMQRLDRDQERNDVNCHETESASRRGIERGLRAVWLSATPRWPGQG